MCIMRTSLKVYVSDNIYSLNNPSELMNQCVTWALQVLYVPPSCIWKEDKKLSFSLKLRNLKRAGIHANFMNLTLTIEVQLDAEHCFAKAKKLWKEKLFYKAKKNLGHALRYC
jgi:hypothetical protein